MKKLTKLFALLLAVLMLTSALTACGGGSGAAADRTPNAGESGVGATGVGTYGGHMTLRINSNPNGMDPLKQTGTWKYLYTMCVYENALTRDANDNIVPGVCDFELSEDMLDLKLWVRDGYTFSNGDPVDIYDVEASWNRALAWYSNIKKHVAPNIASMTVENDGEKDILHVVFKQYHEKVYYYMAGYRTFVAIMPKEICEKYSANSSFITDQIEDAIGTGPYKFAYFQDGVKVSLVKREDYVPVDNSAYSGMGGTKYGYLDSITFVSGMNDATAAVALLAGDIDMVEVLPSDYEEMARSQGLTMEVLDSDQSTAINFNSKGENLCSKYPSLRKAILAAIDYPSFLSVLTDGSAIALDDPKNHLILTDLYNTEAWREQDYYGAAQQEVVDKSLAQAKEEGYKGEPIQIVYSSNRSDIPTMMCDALANFGINYKYTPMESTQYNTFISSYSNDWDFYFGWVASAYTPATLGDSVLLNSFKSDRRDEMVEQMYLLQPDSAEYLALWDELSQMMADEAYFGWMARIDWWWWHPETLHSNDEGLVRYVYNTYWDDPQNHPTPANF